ncbi:MAG: CHC2 zinc finger domain-containing protein [Pseudomonadota bacterium]
MNARTSHGPSIDDLKARVMLSALIMRCGVQLHKNGHEWKGLCPFHSERTPSFTVNDAKGFFYCFGCGETGDHFDFLTQHQKMDFKAARAYLGGSDVPVVRQMPAGNRPQKQESGILDFAARMWAGADRKLASTIAETYLQKRGLDLRKLGFQPACLRFIPKCAHPNKQTYPAIIAKRLHCGGRAAGIHRIYIDAQTGDKIRDAMPRCMLGRCAGSYIPVWRGLGAGQLRPPLDMLNPSELAAETLYIAEGVEDALAIAVLHPALRVVSALSLNNMPALIRTLPPTLVNVVVCPDNPKIGNTQEHRAFDAICDAANSTRRNLHISAPPEGCKDFNDVLMRGKGL